MSPPQVWGPATWSFFHTLAHKVNDNQPPIVYQQIFLQIRRICGFLPCPECSRDASIFLGKIKKLPGPLASVILVLLFTLPITS